MVGEELRFFVSRVNDVLNSRPYRPELETPYLCLNPYYKVHLTEGADVRYLLDSGAFQDVKGNRMSYEDALERQLKFEKTVGRQAYAIVSYDYLVDEQMIDGKQTKRRVSKEIGEKYVEHTLEAAEYLVSRRDELGDRKLVLSCQGSDTDQYLDCLEQVIALAKPGDIIGLGGYCILSKSKSYEEQYYSVLREGFPMIRDAGINRVHVFGMGVFRALVQTDVFGRMNGIDCSYDTSAAEVNAVFGNSFNPVHAQMSKVFDKIHKNRGYYSADLAMLNVRLINNYWEEVGRMPLPENFVPSMRNRSAYLPRNIPRVPIASCTPLPTPWRASRSLA